MKTILILAANPRRDLNLDREIRDLKGVIVRSGNSQQFDVEDALAVRVGDLQELLFRYKPQIVHFCGHGSGDQGLVFEANDGGEQWVRTDALSNLFNLFSNNVSCVLLNACYSEEQANAIVEHIDYVIGMNQEIRDDAAIAFSKGFYQALGFGCSVEDAFKFGHNAIQLEISGSSKMRSGSTETQRKLEVVNTLQTTKIPEHLKPVLKKRPGLVPSANQQSIDSGATLSREEIQLKVDQALRLENASLTEFRGKVRASLAGKRLTESTKSALEQLRQDLGLSIAEAQQILNEEQTLAISGHSGSSRLGRFSRSHWQMLGVGASLLVLATMGIKLSLPIVSNYYLQAGLTKYKSSNLGGAELDLKQAVSLNPANAEAHSWLGSVYEDLQKTDSARNEYQLAIQGEYTPAVNNLARLHILSGNSAGAIPLLLNALESDKRKSLEPEVKHAILKNLGWARLEQKDYASAEMYLLDAIDLQKSKKLEQGTAAPYCLLAQVREAQRRMKDALLQWEGCNQRANSLIPEEDRWATTAQKRLAAQESP